jgi:uncharacterized protein
MIAQVSDPFSLRSPLPGAWPQYPYDEPPRTPEESPARYEVAYDFDQSLTLSDGTRLLLDLYRPRAPEGRFPVLVSFLPYTRQLQRDSAPVGQNEAGIGEFWAPRGYVLAVVDARGTNGSEGIWDCSGPQEVEDVAEILQWAAEQPWSDGRVGMMGCSYGSITQLMVGAKQPPSLRAIFPYDALTDTYRHAAFPGGMPGEGLSRYWYPALMGLNAASGRTSPEQLAAMMVHYRTLVALEQPEDGEYWRERSAWPTLEQIEVPAYLGSSWDFHAFHLRGTFDAWQRISSTTKRMLVGPSLRPTRPWAAYHMEALRWYDLFLKDLDSGVLEGPPIRLWVNGEERWRGEQEWPLARTEWKDFRLDANGGLGEAVPESGERVLANDPADDKSTLLGTPRLVYRSEPSDSAIEVTGPLQLDLRFTSTATDTDWIVRFSDEAPDGTVRELTRGWLRSSHRSVDPELSSVADPWHPHVNPEPITPGETVDLQIGIVPTCNVFKPGHKMRLDISNVDNLLGNTFVGVRRTIANGATNTVLHGPNATHLRIPQIPQ